MSSITDDDGAARGGSFDLREGSPLICAHACSTECGSPNTLAGLRQLLDDGIEMVEFDVRRIGDGALVAHHSERIPDGRPVRRLRYEALVAVYPPTRRPARVEELVGTAA